MSEKPRKWWDDSMDLPAGKTCGDCRRFRRCVAFIGASLKPTNIWCDWSPSQFVAAVEPTPPGAGVAP